MRTNVLKYLLLIGFLTVSTCVFAGNFPASTVMLQSVTAVGVGSNFSATSANRTFQATETGTGTVSATVEVQASDDGVGWVTLGTITLSGTSPATDGFASSAAWQEVRGNVTAISGTSAAVTLTMGVQ